MNIKKLEQNLLKAQKHLDVMQEQAKHTGDPLHYMLAAWEVETYKQRIFAATQGQEYAVPLDFGVTPEAAISGPILLQDDQRTYLAFNAMRPTPGVLSAEAGLAIVELEACGTTRFGYPNDEARPGHPLYNRGLSGYGIFEVFNSLWIDAQVEMNRVRFPKTKRNKRSRHFIFTFHDSTLECLAYNIKVEVRPYSPRFERVYEVLRAWWKLKYSEDDANDSTV